MPRYDENDDEYDDRPRRRRRNPARGSPYMALFWAGVGGLVLLAVVVVVFGRRAAPPAGEPSGGGGGLLAGPAARREAPGSGTYTLPTVRHPSGWGMDDWASPISYPKFRRITGTESLAELEAFLGAAQRIRPAYVTGHYRNGQPQWDKPTMADWQPLAQSVDEWYGWRNGVEAIYVAYGVSTKGGRGLLVKSYTNHKAEMNPPDPDAPRVTDLAGFDHPPPGPGGPKR